MIKSLRWILPLILIGLLFLLPPASQAQEDDDPDRGAYLAIVAGCAECHSPFDGEPFSGNLIQTHDGADIYAPNLTPSESGIGGWSDEEIKSAITNGISADGERIHPVMPYLYYNSLADSDLDALVDFLRDLDPVESSPTAATAFDGLVYPDAPERESGITVPPIDDQVAYGGYLVESVLACGSCHTPPDESGRPDLFQHMGGGMAFAGEWGRVYSANLTPDMASGIGPQEDDTVILAIIGGTHSEGALSRPIYGMNWQSYSFMNGSDVTAVMTYLRTLPIVPSDVPPPELNEGYDDLSRLSRAEGGSLLSTILLVVIIGGVLAAVVYTSLKQMKHGKKMKEIDWEEHFKNVLSEAREKEAAAQAKSEEDDS